jgi:hypothetical protein
MKNLIGKKEILIFFVLALIGIASRIFPHPPNFTSVAAVSIIGGFYLSRKKAIILPLLVMFLSDFFIGHYQPILMAFVYLSFLSITFLPLFFKRKRKWRFVLSSSFLGAVLFFLITNFAVFAFSPWYEKTLFGLIQCYTLALPFFRNTLFSTLIYSTTLFAFCQSVILFKKDFNSFHFGRKTTTISQTLSSSNF